MRILERGEVRRRFHVLMAPMDPELSTTSTSTLLVTLAEEVFTLRLTSPMSVLTAQQVMFARVGLAQQLRWVCFCKEVTSVLLVTTVQRAPTKKHLAQSADTRNIWVWHRLMTASSVKWTSTMTSLAKWVAWSAVLLQTPLVAPLHVPATALADLLSKVKVPACAQKVTNQRISSQTSTPVMTARLTSSQCANLAS